MGWRGQTLERWEAPRRIDLRPSTGCGEQGETEGEMTDKCAGRDAMIHAKRGFDVRGSTYEIGRKDVLAQRRRRYGGKEDAGTPVVER